MIVALGILLLLSPTVFCHDSEGTLFYWNYIRNADSDTNVPNQNLSVTIMNGANAASCDFTMFYRDDFFSDLTSKTVTVAANSSAMLIVPSYYGFAYDSRESPQTSQVPNVTLSANSSCPVTVLANNFDSVTGQGDSFMVLPANWASTYFTFTLPPALKTADNSQYQVVTFISTQGTANVQLSVVEHDGGSPLTLQVNTIGGLTDYIALTTPEGQPRTYRVLSDLPIQIVAGVTCVGVYGGSCDHVAFMPQPVPSFDCRSYEWVDDDHVSDTVSTGSFYIDIPNTCSTSQNVTATSAGSASQRQVQMVTLNPSKISVLQNYSSFGRAVSFHAGGSATHITRVYDSSSAGGKGAFVTSVASLTSFILAPSYFYTRNANDSIEVICTSLVCSAIYIDDNDKLNTASSDVISVDGVSYFSMSYVVPNPGMHFITYRNTPTTGGYTYYVIGKSNNYGYGYLGHVNLPSLVVLPTTTPPSPGTTFTPPVNPITTGTTTTVTTPSTVSTISTATPASTISTASTASPPSASTSTAPPPNTQTTPSGQTTVTTPTAPGMTTSTPTIPSTAMSTSPPVTQTTSNPATTTAPSTPPSATPPVATSSPPPNPSTVATTTTPAASTVPNLPTTTISSPPPVVTTVPTTPSTVVSISSTAPSTLPVVTTAPPTLSTVISTSPTAPSTSTASTSTMPSSTSQATSPPVVSTSPTTMSTSTPPVVVTTTPSTPAPVATTSTPPPATFPTVPVTSSTTNTPTTTQPTLPTTTPPPQPVVTTPPPAATTPAPVVTTSISAVATPAPTTIVIPPVTTSTTQPPPPPPTTTTSTTTTTTTTRPTTTTPKSAWIPALLTTLCLIVSACIL